MLTEVAESGVWKPEKSYVFVGIFGIEHFESVKMADKFPPVRHESNANNKKSNLDHKMFKNQVLSVIWLIVAKSSIQQHLDEIRVHITREFGKKCVFLWPEERKILL